MFRILASISRIPLIQVSVKDAIRPQNGRGFPENLRKTHLDKMAS